MAERYILPYTSTKVANLLKKADSITFDDAPTQGSNGVVTSGGVFSSLEPFRLQGFIELGPHFSWDGVIADKEYVVVDESTEIGMYYVHISDIYPDNFDLIKTDSCVTLWSLEEWGNGTLPMDYDEDTGIIYADYFVFIPSDNTKIAENIVFSKRGLYFLCYSLLPSGVDFSYTHLARLFIPGLAPKEDVSSSSDLAQEKHTVTFEAYHNKSYCCKLIAGSSIFCKNEDCYLFYLCDIDEKYIDEEYIKDFSIDVIMENSAGERGTVELFVEKHALGSDLFRYATFEMAGSLYNIFFFDSGVGAFLGLPKGVYFCESASSYDEFNGESEEYTRIAFCGKFPHIVFNERIPMNSVSGLTYRDLRHVIYDRIFLKSCTEGSNKAFSLKIDDSGTIIIGDAYEDIEQEFTND